jgi:hypothetical protein
MIDGFFNDVLIWPVWPEEESREIHRLGLLSSIIKQLSERAFMPYMEKLMLRLRHSKAFLFI